MLKNSYKNFSIKKILKKIFLYLTTSKSKFFILKHLTI